MSAPFSQLPFQTLVDDLSTGVLLLTEDEGVIQSVNPAFCDLLQVQPEQVIGQSIQDWVRFSDTSVATFLKAASSEKYFTCTGEWLSESGGAIKLKFKFNRLEKLQHQIVVLADLFSEDVTLIQAHSDFVSTVSHEFRTPLTSIKGFADTMLQYGTQIEPEQQQRFIAIIKDQADRLIRLVENLLTVSKLGSGKQSLSFRPIELKKLLEKIVQSIQAKQKTTHRFVYELHPATPPVWADPDRLEQVLMNLIDNAVKYSPADTTITLKSYVPSDDSGKADAGQIVIEIRDAGIGIPAEVQTQLFSKFYRVESPLTQKVEGTGLGLYITKSLTVAMGGEIDVISPLDITTGKGTCFKLSFAAATPERQAAHRRRLLEV